MRLNRFIARSGYCSRRKADQLIEMGKVKVNGKVVKDFGYRVDTEKDRVEIDGKLIKLELKKVYIKLYKPRGYLTQLGKDKFGRKTLTDLFKEVGIKDNVFPAGRLDYESEGLLLLTNDGDFANMIMHPKSKIKKTYVVKVKGRVNLESFNRMRKGALLEDGFIKPDEIKILKKGKNYTWLEITIHSGKKRIIRRFTKYFGYPVERLIRTRIGSIELGSLKEKEWKYIDEKIINRMSKSK
ncbi:MAG TPA: rRNA pseudouridine synthase [Persephonella sp.]|nr:rRNA pseudouridine synthase [Persephonella sp.]